MTEFTESQARKSALVVAATLAALAAWQIHRDRPTMALVLGAAAVGVGACAAVAPAAVRFHRAWMTLAEALGFVNTRVLLGLFYFVLLTPVGVARRLMGRDPLDRRKGVEATYWRKRTHTRQPPTGYERSF